MRRKQGIISAVIIAAQVFVLAAIVSFSYSGVGAGATGSVSISGTVVDSSDNGISGVSVYATAPGGTADEFGPVTTGITGSYTLSVSVGTYDFHFDPPSGSSLGAVVDKSVTVLGNETINEQLVSNAVYTISGTVTDASGNPVAGIGVIVSYSSGAVGGAGNKSFSATTDVDGNYSIQATPGTYTVGIGGEPSSDTSNLPSEFSIAEGSIDLTNANITQQNFQLPPTATLTVITNDANGNPVSNVYVGAQTTGPGQNETSCDGGSCGGTGVTTGANGTAMFSVFQGSSVPASNGTCANYPVSNSRVCNTTPITVGAGGATVILTGPAVYTISGTVTDASGNPVAGIGVIVSYSSGAVGGAGNKSFSATTDVDGNYSIQATPGTYTVGIGGEPSSDTSNLPSEFSIAEGSIDLTNANITQQNFQLPPTATLTVITNDANGNPVSNVYVGVSALGVGTDDACDGGNCGGTGITTGSAGTATFTVFQNYTAPATFGICASYPVGTTVCNTSSVSVGTETTVTLTGPTIYTLSGTVTDANGNPVSGISVSIGGTNGDNFSATTDVDGNYSIQATPDTYTVGVGAQYYSGSDNLPSAFSIAENSITLVNLNVTQSFQLPPTAPLTVITNDANGNPISNVYVGAQALGPGNSTEACDGGNCGGIGVTTGANGTATFTMFQDYTVPATNGICANYPEGTTVCNTDPVSIGAGGASLILQSNYVVTSAPANLTAPTATNQSPVLTWNAVNGATSYNIYRDGSEIGSTTNTTYTDNSILEGSYTYYVTAYNSTAGESSPSNSVTVTYDNTPPSITYTLSPTPNSAGWNNTPVTVTFSCSDAGSGVASCTAPVTVSTDGANQTVTGTATDNAGNTATTTATVNLDQTAPTLGTPSWVANPVTQGSNTTLTVPATDNLSGVAGGEYYIGSTDPGQGNGTPMMYNSTTGNLCASLGSTLAPGTYQVNVRGEDAAGNWSTVTTTTLTITSTKPTVGAISAPATVAKATSFNATATFTDPGAAGPYTAQWNWGDGTTSVGTVTNPSGINPGSASGSHSYANPGSYIMTLSVTNENGLTATNTFTIAVSANGTNSFKGTNLSGLTYSNADLSSLDISGSNLQNGTFNGTNFTGSNLAGDNAQGASFLNANLTNTDLAGANFQNANLTSVNLTGANLKGANFKGTTMTGVTYSNTVCPDGTNSNNDGGTCVSRGGGL